MTRQSIQWGESKLTPQEFIEMIKTSPDWNYRFMQGVLAAILPVHVFRDMADAGFCDVKDILQKREDFIADYLDFKIMKPYDLATFERMIDYFELVQDLSQYMIAAKENNPGDA